MGEYSHFRFGQKAPNNGVYMEIGETGSMVKDPQRIKLKAGEKFPQNTNFDRVWTLDKN
ncbi:YjzC family protein [Virgibacillus phasianinus]|uniref:YjzC family protein n=1 Tax=Virgibacillus phasianinus TaxID=2017483 RepID=A0A220TYU1_9BACI|nr:YjzC family protein [Virgibacillus phasianinus]ASK60833.1 YjzC family protein [Virgibacillus phasianinus]